MSTLQEVVDDLVVYPTKLVPYALMSTPHSFEYCPIATYLRAQGFTYVYVDAKIIGGGEEMIPTPATLQEFMETFDGGWLNRGVNWFDVHKPF